MKNKFNPVVEREFSPEDPNWMELEKARLKVIHEERVFEQYKEHSVAMYKVNLYEVYDRMPEKLDEVIAASEEIAKIIGNQWVQEQQYGFTRSVEIVEIRVVEDIK